MPPQAERTRARAHRPILRRSPILANHNATNRYFVHAASSKTTYTRPGCRPGEGSALKRPPPLASLMGLGGAGSVKRRTEDDHSKVEIEYFSKEEEARAAACKGE